MMFRAVYGCAFLASAAVAGTCYDSTGAINTGLQACDPSAAITPCCGNPDYCLSNGLCFNAGANNLLGNQGCTDQNWGSPCHRYCTGETWATNLFPCSNTEIESNGAISYCCGPSSSCCTNTSLVFSVPVGSIILRPSQLAAYLSSTSSIITTTATTSFRTTSSSTNSASTTSATSIPSSYHPETNSLALGLGLGLGLPLGLLLIAALVFLAWELRKQNQRAGMHASDIRTRMDGRENVQAEGQKAELPADCN